MEKTGLVFGKFDIIHLGHINLIRFAKEHCDTLNVLLCSNSRYDIVSPKTRLEWLKMTFNDDPQIIISHTDIDLPYTSESDREISRVWSEFFISKFPETNIVFTSEKYGDYCAEYMGIEHMCYDSDREKDQISSTLIKSNIMKWFDYIAPVARPYFVKKVCICGTESTGKTVLSEYLSKYYKTTYVRESAEFIDNTDNCTVDDLYKIITLRAARMKKEIKDANRIIFSDTDLYTAMSYSKFLFGEDLHPPEWIEKMNDFSLYLFLYHDAPYVQNGMRLSFEDRNKLGEHHLNFFREKGVNIQIVRGTDWVERQAQSIKIIDDFLANGR